MKTSRFEERILSYIKIILETSFHYRLTQVIHRQSVAQLVFVEYGGFSKIMRFFSMNLWGPVKESGSLLAEMGIREPHHGCKIKSFGGHFSS